jgi:hypothetical protein
MTTLLPIPHRASSATADDIVEALTETLREPGARLVGDSRFFWRTVGPRPCRNTRRSKQMNDDQNQKIISLSHRRLSETIERIAADIFNSETRRGWLANKCSCTGDVPPDISEEAYIARFVEKYRDTYLGELVDMADIARPSNMPTAYERGL